MALIVGFYTIYRSLLTESPVVRHLARLGYVLAIITAALAGVLHAAVDGIALKMAVNAWNTAAGTDKLAAFAAAEGIRWTEMSLNSIYDVAGGLAIFAEQCGVRVYGGAGVCGRLSLRTFANDAAGIGDAVAAADLLGDALELWRGEVLADVECTAGSARGCPIGTAPGRTH
jgi:hypothetical protein